MRVMASPSVKLPHQPVEMVHKPKPISETLRSVSGRVRNFMGKQCKMARAIYQMSKFSRDGAGLKGLEERDFTSGGRRGRYAGKNIATASRNT